MMGTVSALVKPVRATALDSIDKRHAARRPTTVAGVTRPTEPLNGLSWGAIVKDISPTAVGLCVCFPFRPGTYLVVDLEGKEKLPPRSLLARVANVRDLKDGT